MGATILVIGQECRQLCCYLEKILLWKVDFIAAETGRWSVMRKWCLAPYLVIFHLSYRLGATNFIEPFFLCSEQEVSVNGSKSYLSLIAPMEHICHFPEQWQCPSLWEAHMCLWCHRYLNCFFFFLFFQLAWFSLTNLLFGTWLLSAVSLSDTFDMLWCSHNVHQEALTHPSWTLFQPEVHSKGDHISKMRLRANQAFLLISASEDRLGKHAEGWKNMVFMV
jgi:hypothetical protein